MARVVQFEGRTISLPDDATDDEVRHALDSGASPPAAPQRTDLASQAAAGLNEGLATTAGRPLDALITGLRHTLNLNPNRPLAPEIVHPVENFYNRQTADVAPADRWLPKVVRKGGEFVGANLPLALTGIGAAASGARSGVQAAELAPGLLQGVPAKAGNALDQLLATVAKKPVSTFAAENLAAAEAGGVGELARQKAEQAGIGPVGQSAAEMTGQMLGPPSIDRLSPAFNAVRFVRRAGETAIPFALGKLPESVTSQFPASVRNIAEAEAAQNLAKAQRQIGPQLDAALSTPESTANLAEAQRLESAIPGFRPDIARATNDPVLLAARRNVDINASGGQLRQGQEAYDANAQAIRDYMQGRIPPAGEFPAEQAMQSAQNRVENVNQGIGGQIEATRGKLQTVAESLPQVDRAQAGDVLRAQREAAQQTADQEVTRLRQAIARPDTPIQVGDQTTTVNGALDRRAAINQELRDYYSASARTVEDVRRMRELQTERSGLDRAIEQINLPGMQAYRSYYRDVYAPAFLEGASRDIGRYSQFGYGKNLVKSENVPGRFFGPNNISEARQFNSLYGNDPKARQAMTDYALDDLRHTATDPATGFIREGSVARWLQKNERLLNEMPWVRDAVAARNPDQLYARLGELENRQKAIGKTRLSKIVERVQTPGHTPETAIDTALNDPQSMQQLVNSVRNDPQAQGALRRAVWDRLSNNAPDVLTNPAKFRETIDKYRRSLSVALAPSHIADLENIAKAAEIQMRAPRPIGTSETPQSILGTLGDVSGVTIPSAAGSLLSIARGRTSPYTEVPMQALKALNKNVELTNLHAWQAALNDPRLARMLSDNIKVQKPTPLRIKHMRTYLLTSGALKLEGKD